MTKARFDNPITVWHHQARHQYLSNDMWDELSYYVVNTFGMPGDRYTVDMNMDRMIWNFDDPKDALIFKLKFSKVIA